MAEIWTLTFLKDFLYFGPLCQGIKIDILDSQKREPQWSKNQIIFQGGAGPKFDKFPSETYLVMAKYQKLAKSVEGN